MITLLIKKAFFDTWDNLITIVLFNLGYLVFFTLGLLSLQYLSFNILLLIAVLLVILFATSVYSGAVANIVYNYTLYKADTIENFKIGFTRNFKHSLALFIALAVAISIIFFVIPFYSAIGNMFGYVISLVLVWALIIFAFALQYYFALSSFLPGDNWKKTIKKCFIILFDNLGISFVLMLHNIVCVAVTTMTMGLIPGFTSINLTTHVAVKILMYKYDYIEENPTVSRKEIPMSELLEEEHDKLGPRTFKNFIFPWK